MKTIITIDQNDFNRLDETNLGEILFNEYSYQSLLGGLDSFRKTKKQAIVIDIGTNGRCRNYIVRISKI